MRRRPARPPRIEELEARILFSAEAAALLPPSSTDPRQATADVQYVEATTTDTLATRLEALAATDAETTTRHEIVFVDGGLADADALIADWTQARAADPATRLEIVRLDPNADGLAQITEALRTRSGLDAVHIVSHAAPGQLRLGATALDAASASARAADLLAWRAATTADADLLLWGCDLAADANGTALMQTLADLTGTDVAASTDRTGGTAPGSNLALESRVGTVETDLAAAQWALGQWGGTLSTYTVTNTLDDGSTGSLRWAITQANANAGTDTISFAIGAQGSAQTITLTSLLPNITDSVVLDARTQGGAGYTGAMLVRLDGNSSVATGLTVTAGNSTIAGFSITRFTSYGLVLKTAGGNVVEANAIGVDAQNLGSTANWNGGDGIRVHGSSNNRIGGTTAAQANLVAYNHGAGISVDSASTGVALLGNSVLSNGNGSASVLNIDLGSDGVTPNDNLDGDSGANGLQNTPVLSSATVGTAGTRVIGSLNSQAGTTYRIEVFSSLMGTEHASGTGGARRLLGTVNVTTDTLGNASFDTTFAAWINAGDKVTATATQVLGAGSFGGTSEFSGNITATSSGGVIVVNTSADTLDGTTTSLTNLMANRGSDNRVSLREAVQATNNTANGATPDLIAFDIFGWGPQTITLSYDSADADTTPDLLGVYQTAIIDGSTQVGYAGSPLIFINGAGTAATGIDINGAAAAGSTVRGLGFQGFTAQGLSLASNGNTVVGSWFGLNTAGTGAAGNAAGINVWDANNNIIGGNTAADRNVISGNNVGIAVNTDNGSSTGNQIRGNYIGTNAAGTAAVGNVNQGLWINAAGNTIGGTTAGQGNVISGTTNWVGMQLTATASNTLVAGNLIGLNAAGTAALGNAADGLYIESANNTIGGTTAAARNVISGNGLAGIKLIEATATGNVVIGNYLGTNAAGTGDVNGTAQVDGASGVALLNGASYNRIGTNADGSNDAAERNLISGNNWVGVDVIGAGTSHNVVQGNYIGTDATGLVALGNSLEGVSFWGSSDNQVGSGAAGAGNVISGNGAGVYVGNGATSNKVQGNLIGLGADGSTVVGNTGAGVQIDNGDLTLTVTGNLVGTDADGSQDAAERNVISGNNRGVTMQDAEVTGNTVAGNYIGTDATGLLDRGNTLQGVYLFGGAHANTIGGSLAAQRNVISGNDGNGIEINGEATDDNVVRGNWIGVSADGSTALGNGGYGLYVFDGADNTLVGGTGASDGNWFAGGLSGVFVKGDSSGTVIQGNRIGTDLAGTANWGTQQISLLLENGANHTLVGGTAAGAGNFIANAGQGGLFRVGIGVIGANSTDNSFLGNTVTRSSGLGIDLGNDGVTANDGGDADTGPNGLQNTPTLSDAVSNGTQIRISGQLASTANSHYRLEFFANDSGNASGHGEGQTFLGFLNVDTDAAGLATYTVTLSATVAVGASISATATRTNATYDSFGDTSEFAANVTARAPGITVTPTSGLTVTEAGGTAQFTVVLDSAPTANVTLALSTGDASEGTLSTSLLTFTPANWAVAQAVTVTGVDDSWIDGNVTFTVLTAAATSADPLYNGLNAADVTLTNTDDDTVNTLVVTTTADTADGDTSSIAALMANRGADGQVSLREAILATNATANGSGGVDRILFNIAGPLVGGAHTLTLASALPGLTDGVLIDGSSEPDAAPGAPVVVLDGNNGAGAGLEIRASNTTARGLVLERFANSGILVTNGAANVRIAGNFIGTDVTGLQARGNGAWGIDVNGAGAGIVIGGATVADRNVIGGNTVFGGVAVNATPGVTVIGNAIGVGADGTTALGNDTGVLMLNATPGTHIGGTAAGEGNVIAHNTGAGIAVWSGVSQAAILGNQIFDNAQQGIDLAWNDTVQANDTGDADTGPNGLQNTPVLASAVSNGSNQVTLTGTLNSAANSHYRIEFYASPTADASGYGEGQRYLGYAQVDTDGSGNATINAVLNAPVAAGEFITATATLANAAFTTTSDTSEFSAHVVATAPNTAPAGTDGTVTATEDTVYTFTRADFGYTDIDGDGFSRVWIDTLPASGTLRWNGNTFAAGNYVMAADLDAGLLTYTPAANAAGAAVASFTFRVQDNGGTTGGGSDTDATPNTLTIDIAAVNDAPVVTLSGTGGTYTENGAAISDPGATVTDIDSANLDGGVLSFQITSGGGTGDMLGILSAGTGPGQIGVSGLNVTYGGTLIGTWNGAGDATTPLTVTLNANATPAAAQALVRALSFANSSDAPTPGTRQFAITLTDGDGGTSAPATASINVVPVNDAPVLTAGGNAGLFATPENTPSGSSTVNNLLNTGSLGYADADTAALRGIAVTATVGHGTWEYSTDGSTWTAFGAVSGSNALLLDGATQFRYVPDGLNGESASFVFRAWDQTAGGAASANGSPAHANPGAGGGTSAYSSQSANLLITVLEVNDAPAGTDGTVAATEDTVYTFTTANFGFSDTDGHALGAVWIDTLPTAGTLALNGVALGAGTAVSATDIGAGRLTYTPAANANGTAAASFTFRVQDNGGTANGGADTDPSANTLSIDIAAVNDAPVATGDNYTLAEDGTLTVPAPGVLANDTDVDGDTLQAAAVTLPTHAATFNFTAAGDIVYTPVADFAGTDSFTYVATDGQGGSSVVTVTFTVTPVNDAPTGAPVISGTATEDQTLTADTSSLADADGLGAYSYQWLRNGVAVAGATASTYTLGDADVGTQIRVAVSYTDGQGTAESVTSAAVGPVANVNDAPTGAPVITGTATENQTLTADTTGLADADGLGTLSYQWLRNGVAIAGATSSTYTLGGPDVGATLRVAVSYTDGQGTAESITSAAVGPVANVNDAPTGAPVITGTTSENQTLAADTTSLADADGLGAFSYQWLRNGVAIAGATSSTYTLGGSDVGATLRVAVSYTDGQGTAESVTSAAVGPVANVNDAPTGAPVIGGTATEDQTLTADTTSLADADGLGTFSYQWLRNGVAITGANAATYTPGDADVGTQIRVTVSYTDGQGTAESITSAAVGPVANVNDAPTGAPVIGGTATEDQTLTADTTSLADADGLGTFSYQWLRNGVAITGANATTYTLGDADVGTQIRVTVSYTDGQGTDESVTSAAVGPVANVNDAPTQTVPGAQTVAEDTPLALGGLSVNDLDANLATTQLSVGHGTLAVDLSGGATLAAGANGSGTLTLAGTQAQINAALATLQYLGDADFNGSDALSVVTTDTAGARVADTVALTVTPVNDAPTSANADRTLDEDQPLILTAADFAFTDVDAGDALQSVQITVLPGAGQLTLGGRALQAGDRLRLADLQGTSGQALVFMPAADANGSPYASLRFRVNDGTADSAEAVLTLHVNPVDDASTLTVGAPAGLATDGTTALTPAQLSLADIDTDVATLWLRVGAAQGGHIESLGAPGVAVAQFQWSQLASGQLRFVADNSSASPWVDVSVTTSPEAAGRLSFTVQAGGIDVVDPTPAPSPAPAPAPTPAPTPAPAPIDVTPAASGKGGVPPIETSPDKSLAETDEADAGSKSAGTRTEGVSAWFSPDALVGGTDGRRSAASADAPRTATGSTADGRVPASGLTALMQALQMNDASAADLMAGFAGLDPLDLATLQSGPGGAHGVDEAGASQGKTLPELFDQLAASPAQATAIALSAGFVWWSLRAAGLVASLLASTPVWQHLDPIPVFDDDRRKRRPEDTDDIDDTHDEALRDEKAAEELLDGVQAMTGGPAR